MVGDFKWHIGIDLRLIFLESDGHHEVEGRRLESLVVRMVAPGKAIFLRGFIPGVVEACCQEILNHGAFRKLTVVVGVEVASDQPADDFFSGELLLHSCLVGDDLSCGFGARLGDIQFTFGSVATVVALHVDGIEHDETSVWMLKGGESEAAAKAGKILDGCEIHEPCGVRFQA